MKMTKDEMKLAISILKRYYERKSETDKNIMMTFLEGLADSEGPYYCMDNLIELAEVIKETDTYFLLDHIQFYDYKAAMILDELVK